MKEKLTKINEYLLEKEFNGAVLIEKDNEMIYSNAYGYADMEHRVLNTTHTKFRIASVTKQMTATAMLKLYSEAKLDIEEPLSNYFKDYPNGDKIKIKHIMSNSSGIQNFQLYADFYDVFKSEDYKTELMKMFKDIPLGFEPGEKYEYSNSGYLLLGYIIEKISGMDYEKYMIENIFKPLGMNDTVMDINDNLILNRARGYKPTENGFENVIHMDMRIAASGGGMLSTIEDIHKWNEALLTYKIIDKKYVDMLFEPNVYINESNDYGYGMFLAHGEIAGKYRRMNYHTGGGPGADVINAFFIDDKINLFLVSNVNDRQKYNEVKEYIENIILN